jgi:DNA-binding response OmpR family regulator
MSHRPRVLVCDHEPLSALALRRVLRDAGFDVDVTSTAADALDHAALRVPDAVIVELGLPDGDGADVCRRVREWSEMPLIVLSAVDAEDEKVRALEAGADHCVVKPLAPRELVARLCAVLRRTERDDSEPRFAVDGLQTLPACKHPAGKAALAAALSPRASPTARSPSSCCLPPTPSRATCEASSPSSTHSRLALTRIADEHHTTATP